MEQEEKEEANKRLRNRKLCEGLIDALQNKLPGSRQQVAERAIRLINQVIDEKALEYLRNKFKTKSYQTLQPVADDLAVLVGEWRGESMEKLLRRDGHGKKEKAKDKKLQGGETKEPEGGSGDGGSVRREDFGLNDGSSL